MKTPWIPLCALIVAVSACTGSRHDAPAAAQVTAAPVPPVAAAVSLPSGPDFWPTNGWRSAAPAEQGMDGGKLEAAMASAQEQKLALHAVLVIRHGVIVMEKYFPPYDESRSHDLFSCTKSFISALVGIAIDKGLVTEVSQPVVGFFPEKTFAHADPRKNAMKVEDLLTMSSGLGWVEGDETYRQMYASSRDWVQFILDLPMKAAPGRKFNYSSGNSHILSAIIQSKSGMKAADFARTYLFGPLGIHGWSWDQDPAGMAIGGWGLHLPPREMAKLGYLYLHNGMWDGKQIVPASWVRTSTEKHIATDSAWDYGYQWWVDSSVPMFAALGRFGQSIFVVPRLDMIAVFTAHIDSNDPEAELVRKYFVPACAAGS